MAYDVLGDRPEMLAMQMWSGALGRHIYENNVPTQRGNAGPPAPHKPPVSKGLIRSRWFWLTIAIIIAAVVVLTLTHTLGMAAVAGGLAIICLMAVASCFQECT